MLEKVQSNDPVVSLKKLNGAKNDTLNVGQRIKLANGKTYIVKPGDSWWKIAYMKLEDQPKTTETSPYTDMGLSLSTSKASTPQQVSNTIEQPKTTTEYTVQSGDTLSKIAKLSHCSVQQLKDLNHLKTDMLKVGQKIITPTVAPKEEVSNDIKSESKSEIKSSTATEKSTFDTETYKALTIKSKRKPVLGSPEDKNLHTLIKKSIKPVTEKLEANGYKLKITSGYRPDEYNSTVTGSSKISQHRKGQAFDFQVSGLKTLNDYQKVAKIIQKDESIQCDQLLVEHRGTEYWIHISYNEDNKGNSLNRNEYCLDFIKGRKFGKNKFENKEGKQISHVPAR